MRSSDFCQNLRLLCSYESSIAAVCRDLKVNRQQFNKYLVGSVFPSARNFRAVCDYFGVTDSEIMLEHARLAEIILLKPQRKVVARKGTGDNELISRFMNRSAVIPDRYIGYYFRYFFSCAYVGYITKSLVRIYRKNGITCWKNIEILKRRDRHEQTQAVYKYDGIVSMIADRIYVFEEEILLRNSVTQTILYPSYTNRIRQLVGIQTALSDLSMRNPAATRVVLEYLAPSINIKKAMKSCGSILESNAELTKEMIMKISNRIGDQERVLSAWVETTP